MAGRRRKGFERFLETSLDMQLGVLVVDGLFPTKDKWIETMLIAQPK